MVDRFDLRFGQSNAVVKDQRIVKENGRGHPVDHVGLLLYIERQNGTDERGTQEDRSIGQVDSLADRRHIDGAVRILLDHSSKEVVLGHVLDHAGNF